MHFYRMFLKVLVLFCISVFLAACNPATMGWSSSQGTDISSSRLSAAKKSCGYGSARNKAVKLLNAPRHKQQNEQRAARLMNDAQQCMAKYNMHYKRSRALGIGPLSLRLK